MTERDLIAEATEQRRKEAAEAELLKREADFKAHFVPTFLASYCATNYADFCARGLHAELEHPPVEDAVFLANEAWEEMKRLNKA